MKSNNCDSEITKTQLEEAKAVKNMFLSNMSHEIRNPLNAIIGIVDLLVDQNIDSEQNEYFKMLKTSSMLLLDIVNSILDMSRLEEGKLELSKDLFNLKDVLGTIVNQLQTAVNKKQLKIMYYIEPFIDLDIIGDKFRLNQIIINLMNNAIKFTDKGQVVLSAKKIHSNDDKIKIQFSVEDTGIGIADEHKDKIFETFYNEVSCYTKQHSGIGLGLAISKEIVKLMNGEIWVESKKGEGSTFYFTAEFYLKRVEPINDTVLPIKQLDQKAVILIVEDNEINMQIIKSFLKIKGMNYFCANNGREAIEVLEKEYVDLILMDIQMPELNGYEATEVIREKERINGGFTPIIAMTAYAMDSDKKKCLESGMDDYISKPFNLEDLNKIIKKYI